MKSDKQRLVSVAIVGLALLTTVAGWRLLWFLTDDAYIAFRYISQRQLGHGYVWNAAPFLPVEGYTSFLWVVLLDGVWSVTGIEPPRAANLLSLLFGLSTVALTAWLTLGICERNRAGRSTPILLSLALLTVVTNRTFLTWTSSGLETALFNFGVLCWAAALIATSRDTAPWKRTAAVAAGSATLLALTRPDGLLFVGATVALVLFDPRRRPAGSKIRSFVPLVPMLVVPLHVLWRRLTYGEWLPNTWFAKDTGWQPEAGLRYASSFLIEYALWVGLALVVAAAYRARRQQPAAVWIVAVTLLVHLGYYTIRVGGDHFEYRVYSHVVPLLAIAVAWSVLSLPRFRISLGLAWLGLALSIPIPWVHWKRSEAFTERIPAHVIEVASAFPPVLRSYASVFDDLQHWLIKRFICVRQHEHRLYLAERRAALPTRELGARAMADQTNPVVYTGNVGLVGWVFPKAHVIDAFGLNDYVVARTPITAERRNIMAHSRTPPPGYVEAFRPNVAIYSNDNVQVRPRAQPLTDDEIRAIERRFREALR